MRYEIKELGLGGVLDQAINLVKNHFGLLFGITLVLFIPWTLLQSFVTLAIMPDIQNQPAFDDKLAQQQALAALENLKYLVPLMLVSFFIVLPVTNAAVIRAIANCYLGKPATVGGSISGALTVLIPLLLTGLLQSLAIMGGFILFIIPGIIFAFWFALTSHVVVIEGTSGSGALSRSKFLMKGNIGTFFVLGLVVTFIQMTVVSGATMIKQPHVSIVVQVILQAVVTVFSLAVFVVFYFSCRCKAEHFDLTLLAESVGAEPTAEPGGYPEM